MLKSFVIASSLVVSGQAFANPCDAFFEYSDVAETYFTATKNTCMADASQEISYYDSVHYNQENDFHVYVSDDNYLFVSDYNTLVPQYSDNDKEVLAIAVVCARLAPCRRAALAAGAVVADTAVRWAIEKGLDKMFE